MKPIIVGLAAAALLACCASVGTRFTEADLAALQPGMTEAEVTGRLGPPNAQSTAASGQHVLLWTYAKSNGLSGKVEGRSVSLIFDQGGRLVREASRSQVGN